MSFIVTWPDEDLNGEVGTRSVEFFFVLINNRLNRLSWLNRLNNLNVLFNFLIDFSNVVKIYYCKIVMR